MKLRWLFVVPAFLLASLPSSAQEGDYELADTLAQRGWYDLAEEQFKAIESSAPTPEQKAEGKFGLARMKLLQAEKTDDPDEKQVMYEEALERINEFTKAYPKHPRIGQALGSIGLLYQSRGKFLMKEAQLDPTRKEEAEASFEQAEKLFSEQMDALNKDRRLPPEGELQRTHPAEFKRLFQEFSDWERSLVRAKYNYCTSLFAHGQAYQDTPSDHPKMQELLGKMVDFVKEDFMWTAEQYLLLYDTFIYVGRAYKTLAESTTDPAQSDRHWQNCFSYIGKAKGLLDEPENRKHPGVREIASRAVFFEMKARMVYGDTRRGGAAGRQHQEAAKIARDLFRLLPGIKTEDLGKAILTERARALCKSGDFEVARQLLEQLIKDNPDTWVENVAVDIMGDYLGEKDPGIAIRAAKNEQRKGPAYLFKAINHRNCIRQSTALGGLQDDFRLVVTLSGERRTPQVPMRKG